MQTANVEKLYQTPDNIMQFPGVEKSEKPKKRTTSALKSDGNPKATPADPIRKLEDIKALKQYFIDHNQIRNYTIFIMGLSFGIRGGDLLSLRVSNVVDADGNIRERCNIYEQKTGKFNQPQIPETIANAIQDWLELNPGLERRDFLFRSRQKDKNGEYQHVKISMFNKVLAKAAKECGIKAHISTHSMRKTFCYHTLRANKGDAVSMATIQYMMNHSSMRTTLNYCGLTQDDAARVRDDWAAVYMGAEHIEPEDPDEASELRRKLDAISEQLAALAGGAK